MDSWVGLFLDLGVLAIFISFVVIYYKKGLLSPLISFAGALLSIYVAGYFSSAFARSIYKNYIQERVFNTLVLSLNDNLTRNTDWPQALENAADSAPFLIKGFVREKFAVLTDDLREALSSASRQVAETAVDNIIRPFATGILTMALFVLFFTLLMLLFKYLSRSAKGLDGKEIPFIGGLNLVLGAVIGFLYALVLIFLVTCAVSVFIFLTGGENRVINNNSLERSNIFRLLYNLNPFIITD
ncbi:MAG: hypothetical protein LBC56_06690 [Oscillospiraceae bacterium]|jgi:ABC-type multidrug transport system fused ATPase/permease subunit|nr:hypothetical protein [Oscillospiraceae bacterium]